MEASTIGMIMGAKALIVFGAFLTILRFTALLSRAKVPGSRFLLAGGIAILLGNVVGAGVFDVGTLALWPSLFLEAMGAIAAAYGFARVTRGTLTQLPRQ